MIKRKKKTKTKSTRDTLGVTNVSTKQEENLALTMQHTQIYSLSRRLGLIINNHKNKVR